MTLTSNTVRTILELALEEDLPDITTDAIFGAAEKGIARFLAKVEGVFAGAPFIEHGFQLLDPDARAELHLADGDPVSPGTAIATVRGSVRALLTMERSILNVIQRASGIATLTSRYAAAIKGTGAEIYDTRKTAPGLRLLDKYAVAAGGGRNHRMGLHDMFLIKDNHIDRAGGIARAVELVRATGLRRPLMIEVRTLDELGEALGTRPEYVLLDNMDIDSIRTAVAVTSDHNRSTGRTVILEASGGITLETIRAVAETGVDRISSGALTHSVTALDISMDILF
ncbi:MAG: carboxylating nicotinate-nucleotide diphosphorylase [Acidobacteria bacterium]|nr:carboxylating nicotinate-nucleotide diphosphorylase [Acidobacteriota bacterium]